MTKERNGKAVERVVKKRGQVKNAQFESEFILIEL